MIFCLYYNETTRLFFASDQTHKFSRGLTERQAEHSLCHLKCTLTCCYTPAKLHANLSEILVNVCLLLESLTLAYVSCLCARQEMLSHHLSDSSALWGFDMFPPPALTVWLSADGQQCSIKKHVACHKQCMAALVWAKLMKKYTEQCVCLVVTTVFYLALHHISAIHSIINIHDIYISKDFSVLVLPSCSKGWQCNHGLFNSVTRFLSSSLKSHAQPRRRRRSARSRLISLFKFGPVQPLSCSSAPILKREGTT